MHLVRRISLLGVFCIAVGAMISSGIFILPGLAFAKTGSSVFLSYLIAGLVAMTSMASTAELITAMPKAGGDFFFVSRSLGPALGTTSALLSWYSLFLKAAFTLIGIAEYVYLITQIDIHISAIFFCIIFLALNIKGIKEASKTQIVLVSIILISILFYIFTGIPFIKLGHFKIFAPFGVTGILGTAGFVFVSYGGLLKVASLAEEIKNPGRNIPIGMLLALLVASIFYMLLNIVTIGVLDTPNLASSLTPISDGAGESLGIAGKVILSIAAVIAFFSTANSGIMSSSRYPLALSRDGLLPGFLNRINHRFSTPHVSILITGFFIMVFIFLKLELLVKTASTVLILTYIFPHLALIVFRESRLKSYNPSFRLSFYPWLQITGIAGLLIFIIEMGRSALVISIVFVSIGFIVYILYGRRTEKREYALLYLIDRIKRRKTTSGQLEEELKEIVTERDSYKD